MNCPPDKHKIELIIDCDLLERLQEAAHITGCGDDLERYILSIITERC